MRTLQERTCARDRALCLRQIHTSERQRAPHDIEARALVVVRGDLRGARGMLKKNAAARSQGLAAARRPMGSAALPGSTTQRVSLPTPVFECFERACTPQRGAVF
jgi:hypothetical protein